MRSIEQRNRDLGERQDDDAQRLPVSVGIGIHTGQVLAANIDTISVVDRDSLGQLDGMVIDFVKTNQLNQGFEFRNPNVKDMCGCGESFSI